jgi:hypothetical protein
MFDDKIISRVKISSGPRDGSQDQNWSVVSGGRAQAWGPHARTAYLQGGTGLTLGIHQRVN